MYLTDIIENKSVKDISIETNIPDYVIDYFIDGDFSHLDKAKALGFISIIEREYNVELTSLRDISISYYKEQDDINNGIIVDIPSGFFEYTKRKLWFYFIIFILFFFLSLFLLSNNESKSTNIEYIPILQNDSSIYTDINTSSIDQYSIEKALSTEYSPPPE